jgi:hypothetical protein
MTEHDTMVKLWSLNRQVASLRFKYYELFTTNRMLAMKLFGYRATDPVKFSDGLVKRMEFYVLAGRTVDTPIKEAESDKAKSEKKTE